MTENGDNSPALDMIMAKLDREPQDPLHAAVVLEAFAGRTPSESMNEVARLSESMPSSGKGPTPTPTGSRLDLKEFLVLITVLASVFVWLPFLRDLLGDDLAPTVAWALPAALACDRALMIRYFASGELRTISRAIWWINAASLTALGLASMFGTAAFIGVALVIVWGQASITAMREWPLAYVNVVIASATWMAAGGDVEIVLTASALAVIATNTVAVISSDSKERVPDSAWVTLAAAVIGASAGMLLTADPHMWRDHQIGLAVAILAVSLSGWWGSVRLTGLWLDLPTRLASITIDDHANRWGGHVVSNAVTGAVMRVLLPTWVLLVVAIALGEPDAAVLVAAFAMFAVAMLLLGLVVATKRWFSAATISALATMVALATPDSLPGLPLLVGSAVEAFGFAVLALIAFRESATTFATRMLVR